MSEAERAVVEGLLVEEGDSRSLHTEELPQLDVPASHPEPPTTLLVLELHTVRESWELFIRRGQFWKVQLWKLYRFVGFYVLQVL